MIRTHEAGTLGIENVGQTVTLAGWIGRRRDHGGVAFLDLRDGSGIVQVVVHDPDVAHPLRNEFCLKVVGEVAARPEGNENPDLATGAIEVMVTSLEVLSESAPLPFPIDDHVEVGEEARLRYRYLDLRRPEPARIMRLRSKVNQIAREVLFARDFLEVETPTLTRSTPEGARDFLVPVRLQPGNWYALPQSPQLFKQLLMVAGMERYFQIARCYRDEDFRKDRQPEFTQLDVEMSFVEQADVLEVGEAVIRALWAGTVGHEIGEIPHMTFAEAMRRFGSDKPDLRFGVELALEHLALVAVDELDVRAQRVELRLHLGEHAARDLGDHRDAVAVADPSRDRRLAGRMRADEIDAGWRSGTGCVAVRLHGPPKGGRDARHASRALHHAALGIDPQLARTMWTAVESVENARARRAPSARARLRTARQRSPR
jgi:aspartyl-tRNA synthetase